ncbi:MAG TPA: phosphotransferase [Solirubrobacteraceae bacterium]|jgi:Ser/Thr protein kinase RdoA (MazF antagonist)
MSGDRLTAVLACYDLPSDSRIELLRHGENTTYRVDTTDGRRFALRQHRPGYQTAAAIVSEIAWMTALREAGVRTPRVVLGIDGRPLQTLQLSLDFALFEWVEGVPLSAIETLSPWRRLGELMAHVHEHGSSWRRPAGFVRPAWDAEALVGEHPRWGAPDRGRAFNARTRSLIAACRAEVSARLAAIGCGADRFGLIHGDLSFENVLVEKTGAVAIIDFDDCGESWFVHELAVALYPHEGHEGFDERRDALVEGYRSVRKLPEQLIAELPTFLMARRLAGLGWVFSRAETEHAEAQRAQRVQSLPAAAERFIAWASEQPVPAQS